MPQNKIINSYHFSIPIEVLPIFGISVKCSNILKRKSPFYLKDYRKGLFHQDQQKEMEKILEALEKDNRKLIQDTYKTLKKTKEYQVLLARAQGFTLQEIGEERQVTRERVRQIIKNYVGNLLEFTENFFFFEQEKGKDFFVSFQDIFDHLLDQDAANIAILILKESKKFIYLKFADKFIYTTQSKDEIECKLHKIAEDVVGEGEYINVILSHLEEKYEEEQLTFLDVLDFRSYLLDHKYRIWGEYVTYGKPSYTRFCIEIIHKHFKKGIRVFNKTDLDILKKYIKEYFKGIQIKSNERAFGSRLAPYLVLCGRGKYKDARDIQIDEELINRINEMILAHESSSLYYHEIYDQFKYELEKKTDIDNHNYLHGILRYYFPFNYTYERDMLIKTGEKRLSLPERMNVLLLEKKGPMSKDEIREQIPGITDMMIITAIEREKDIIQWEFNQYNNLKNIEIQSKEKKKLKELIKLQLEKNKGYYSSGMLFEEIQEKMPEFLERNNIKQSMNLFYIAAAYFSDQFIFRNPHIVQKSLNISTITAENIVKYYVEKTPVMKYEDIYAFAEKFRWSAPTWHKVTRDIEQHCVRLSEKTYIEKKDFKFSLEDQKKLMKALIAYTDKHTYLATYHFRNYEQLPKFSFKWNGYVLESIIKHYKCGMNLLIRESKDRRFLRGVVVNKNIKITEYDQLIWYLWKAENILEISSGKFLMYLEDKNLAQHHIPKEIQQSVYFTCKNDMFRLNSKVEV